MRTLAVAAALLGAHLASGTVRANPQLELALVMEQLRSARVQRDSTRDVKDIRLDLPGLHLELTSGRMAPFEPIVIDGRPRICAVYFQGKGQVSYSAPLDVERAQIRRFFDSDSIHKELEEALFFFSGDLYDSMFSKLPVSQHRLRGKHAKSGRRLLDDLFENDEDYFGIALYRALREATVDPFVLLNLKSSAFMYLLTWLFILSNELL